MGKYNIITFDLLDSTNTYALQNIDALEDRTLILANSQTKGRGKFQRGWESQNTKNIYASLVLKPKNNLDSKFFFGNITQFLSVIICDILKQYGVLPEIKWPNDILISDKKICGILTEKSTKNAGVVVGFGINLELKKEEAEKISRKATSLSAELKAKKDINKISFLNLLLDAFFMEYDSFLLNGFDFFKERYIKYSNFLGKEILINNFDTSIKGIAKSINDDGTLTIENENKKEIKIIAGEIA
ncbi:MAG: biotin--[acetyl-CoA-carboxylase] ligase [Bdellovibrionota bacterium]